MACRDFHIGFLISSDKQHWCGFRKLSNLIEKGRLLACSATEPAASHKDLIKIKVPSLLHGTYPIQTLFHIYLF